MNEEKKKKTTSRKTNLVKKEKVVKEAKKTKETFEDSNQNKDTFDTTIVEEKIIIKKEETPKSVFNFVEVIVIMIITALFSLFVGGLVVYLREYNPSGKCVALREDLEELVSTYDRVTQEYYSSVDKQKLVEAGIKGMLDYLGDPYSKYMPGEESTEFTDELNGKFIGMGAMITVNLETNEIYVTSLFENSPAVKAGIQVNDIISKVAGVSTKDKSVAAVSSMIKDGQVGTKVEVEVIRAGKTIELEITRGTVEIQSVHGEVIEKNNKKIGLITIDRFASNTYDQFEKVYNNLTKEKVDSLILDVRYNSGGHLDIVEKIAAMFLNKGDVIYKLDTKGSVSSKLAKNNQIIKLPTTILVNGGSASASEILVASLKENLNIEIIGTKTYGKGTVQKLVTLSSGATVKYTIQEWLTPDGNRIDKVGIEPTIIIELDKKYVENQIRENDNQLMKALEVITK